MASCISCGATDVAVDKILSTWNFKSEPADEQSNQPQEMVSIDEALSTIFELPPLTSTFTGSVKDVKLFQKSGNLLCPCCGESLGALYNAWKRFMSLVKLESEIGNKLLQLKSKKKPYHRDDIKAELPSVKKKRQSKNKIAKHESKIGDEMEFEMLHQFDESDSDISEKIGGGYNSSDDFSAPDSPIDMDISECPRSPRPIRKSSARNKDWSKYYKDEEDDDLNIEDGEGEIQGNETEVTATDAEGNDEELKMPEPETQAILEKVQVTWDEDKDRDLEFFDDDSDADYLPDEDLENLSVAITEGTHSRYQKRSSSKIHSKRVKQKIYECETCGKIFAHSSSLQKHEQTHLEKDKEVFPCPSCFRCFTNDAHLRKHRRKVHAEYIPYKTKSGVDILSMLEEKKKYPCPICNEMFQRNQIQLHVDTHKIENPWNCEFCESRFSNLADSIRHKNVAHLLKQRENCQVCHQEFRTPQYLNRHQVTVHHARSDYEVSPSTSDGDYQRRQEENYIENDAGDNDDENKPLADRAKFTCPEKCDKTFFRLDALKEHLITHGIGDKFKCEICSREFTRILSKRRHMYLHSQQNNYKCKEEECNKEFSQKEVFIRHLKSSHGIQLGGCEIVALCEGDTNDIKKIEKEIPCPYCEKLVKRERLRLHLVSHTGEKPHQCKQCGLKFGLRTTLRTHIQCIHENLRRYQCTFCEKAFKRSNHLKDHLKLHTEADNKPFTCDVESCGRSFRRLKNLKSHMVTHANEKNFQCEQCGNSFSRMDNMRAHVRSVHQGLQIRKKRTRPSKSAKSKKAAQNEGMIHLEEPNKELKVEEVEVIVPSCEIENSSSTLILPADNIPVAGTSVIVKPSKRAYQPRKRKSKIDPLELLTDDNPPPPTTIVQEEEVVEQVNVTTVETMGQDTIIISAEELGIGRSVQIAEIHTTEEQFDGRTTIVQLAPGEVFPAVGEGQFQTTYYQYYYQE